jgi:hypothetical protein
MNYPLNTRRRARLSSGWVPWKRTPLVLQTRALRRDIEAALDQLGWSWNGRLSRLLDEVIDLEERGAGPARR